MNNIKFYLKDYLSLLKNKNILKIVILSFIFATLLVVLIFFLLVEP